MPEKVEFSDHIYVFLILFSFRHWPRRNPRAWHHEGTYAPGKSRLRRKRLPSIGLKSLPSLQREPPFIGTSRTPISQSWPFGRTSLIHKSGIDSNNSHEHFADFSDCCIRLGFFWEQFVTNAKPCRKLDNPRHSRSGSETRCHGSIKMSDAVSGIRVLVIGDRGSGKTGLVKLNVGPGMQRCGWSP
jgi:hypothetical protein